MTARVIQGFFGGGGPRLPSRVAQPTAMPLPLGPPVPVLAGRPTVAQRRLPGPPAPAFAGRPTAAQRRGAGDAFSVDPRELGLANVGGRPLPDAVRGKMEAALGVDFSNVRVHVGPQAERIGAIAFTLGSDIYFAPGRFQPDTAQGQQLLGHELAHVVQQRQGRVRNPMGSGVAVVQDRALEAEADHLGQRAAAYRVEVQAKMAQGAVQPSSPVRISAPISAGPGTYRLVAGAGGRQIGSVMVHARDKASVEITDLGVDPAHREHGIGKMLLASAARTGLQAGKSKVTLAAQDNGSRRLTHWYEGMGFMQVGVNERGYPQLEAPISRLLAGAVQRRETQHVTPSHRQFPRDMYRGAAVQRMDQGPRGQLGYTGDEPLKPFLRDPQGKPSVNLISKNPNTQIGVYVYQSTRYANLAGIIRSGLDPSHGGGNTGASVLDVSREAIAESKKGSTGVVTVATKTMIASGYAKKFDEAAENSDRRLGDFAVVLRIRNAEDFRKWQKDQQDKRGNYQTKSRIPPDHIEFLTYSGWVPITSIDLSTLQAALCVPFLDDYNPMLDGYRRVHPPEVLPSRPRRGRCTLL